MRDLTGLGRLLNRNGGAVADNREGRRNNPQRHARILNADPADLVAKNLRARMGLDPDETTAPPVTAVEAAVQLSQLDQLIAQERRGPRAAGFDTRLLLKRSRRGPTKITR